MALKSYKIGWCCQNLSSLDLNVLTESENTTWLGKLFQTSSALLVKKYLRKSYLILVFCNLNSYKLENYSFHYDVRKFSFCPDHVVNVATVNMFKAHLDKFWEHQQVVFDFKAELTGTGNRSEYIYNL